MCATQVTHFLPAKLLVGAVPVVCGAFKLSRVSWAFQGAGEDRQSGERG